MSRVKSKNNKKLNRTNLKRTCNHIQLAKKLDLELQQAEWEEVIWEALKCPLQVHQQKERVEESTGPKLHDCYQLVRLIQINKRQELNFGVDSITTVMAMFHLPRLRKVSVMS